MAEKKYLIDNTELMAEWNWDKNTDLDPHTLTMGSNKKVWWKCSKGHEWQAVIANRSKGRKCPYCAGSRVLKNFNDLQTVNPILANEWNYEKNENSKPYHFTASSGKKVWWKCANRHEWQATISSRNNGNACPYCSGRYAIKGENDLRTVNPILAKEWNYEKNRNLKPDYFTANSGKKVWWKCSKGHEWQATICNRNNGNGCPVCSSERSTSFPEYAIAFYLEKYGIETIHSYNEKGYELDIYIPEKKVAIEYDGYFWHKNKVKQDLAKNSKCKEDGIILYRIREGLPPLNDSSLDYIVQTTQKDFSIILVKILKEIIGIDLDIDIDRDRIAIENLREFTEKDNSLLFSNPEIANEWNHEKNGNLKPEHFAANSGKKVWWKCSNGHEWRATINSRNSGTGCPYCAGRHAIKGVNDLQTVNPILAKEWNYEKNNEITPEMVTASGSENVWWKCSNGHEWQSTINHRKNGRGCPYCSGKKVLKGYNDLQTINPALAKEWNYEKNGILKPEHFTAHSSKKVWWRCTNGHEWQAAINSRSQGTRCPYCSSKKVLKGYNDLQTINPTLANEWNYEKNGDSLPEHFTANSGEKAWWKCSKGHEWQATIASRNDGRGCPCCSGNQILKGYNDLQTVNPNLANEWNYEKNTGLTPMDVMPNSGKIVWWKCIKGHEWQARIQHRNRGSRCPICHQNKRTHKS